MKFLMTKVVILCGGLGTRIGHETKYKPKPMIKIDNRPIIWHIMKILRIMDITIFYYLQDINTK